MSHPFLSDYSLQYHLDDIDCSGSEDMLSTAGDLLEKNAAAWGEISVKITQWCSHSIRVYGIYIRLGMMCFIWVWSFHSGMVFSFGYGLFVQVWCFH